MSSLRKQLMAAMMAGGGETQEPYIEDGLVFWLDCRDATTSSWVDKIGNKSFSLYSVTKDSLGGIVFAGAAGSYGKSTSNIYYDKSACTIEVVVNSVSNAAGGVFCNTQGGLSFYYTSTNIVRNGASKSSNGSKWTTTIAGTHVVSLANTIAYQDGALITYGGSESFGGNDSGTYLGRRDLNTNNNSVRDPFKGTIYQVRIYNRLLTAEEIAYNHGLDMAKYNITT